MNYRVKSTRPSQGETEQDLDRGLDPKVQHNECRQKEEGRGAHMNWLSKGSHLEGTSRKQILSSKHNTGHVAGSMPHWGSPPPMSNGTITRHVWKELS